MSGWPERLPLGHSKPRWTSRRSFFIDHGTKTSDVLGTGRALRLEADNDYHDKGLALLDEFSDAIVACVKDAEYSDMRVISVTSF